MADQSDYSWIDGMAKRRATETDHISLNFTRKFDISTKWTTQTKQITLSFSKPYEEFRTIFMSVGGNMMSGRASRGGIVFGKWNEQLYSVHSQNPEVFKLSYELSENVEIVFTGEMFLTPVTVQVTQSLQTVKATNANGISVSFELEISPERNTVTFRQKT
jgi:hypothetical protein